MRDLLIGVDLGATKILAGIASADGRIINKKKIPTGNEKDAAPVLDRISYCVKEIIKESCTASDEIGGIAIATPGPLSYGDSLVMDSPNLGWSRVALKEELEKRIGERVVVDKDTNMAALGELCFARNGSHKHLLYVTISTGIGGAVIINGKLYRGLKGGAGEFGHMVIEARGKGCNCGRNGCLEALASGTAIARQAAELVKQGKGRGILACSREGEVSAREVGNAARNGDSEARAIINSVNEYLGIGITNLVNIFNPEIIVLGGGVALGLEDLILEPVLAHVRKNAFALNKSGLKMELTTLGEDIGLYGCLASLKLSSR